MMLVDNAAFVVSTLRVSSILGPAHKCRCTRESQLMAEQCFLAVDLGAESGRVVAGLFDGTRLRLEEIHRFANGAVPLAGTLRWDMLRLWSDILAGLGKAAQS